MKPPLVPCRLLAFALALGAVLMRTAMPDAPAPESGLNPLVGFSAGLASPVRIEVALGRGEAGRPDVLRVTAILEDGWHLYSIDQKPGGPKPTRIVVAEDSPQRPSGPFVPDAAPHARTVTDVPSWNGLVVEEHADRVTWQAPLAPNPSGHGGAIHGTVSVQLCRENACTPPETIPFSVAAAPTVQSAGRDVPGNRVPPPDSHTPDRGHITIDAFFGPSRPSAGGMRAWPLTVRLQPHASWHLYAPASTDSSGIGQGKPTIVSLATSPTVLAAKLRTLEAAIASDPDLAAARAVEGPLTVQMVLQPKAAPETTGQGAPAVPAHALYTLDAVVGYQTCTHTACDPPSGVRLTIVLPTDDDPASGTISFAEARYADAAIAPTEIAAATGSGGDRKEGTTPLVSSQQTTVTSVAADTKHLFTPNSNSGSASLPLVLLMGLAGGLILNLMPCVLPVLGLKLMSFAQQSGRRRQEIFALNLWYCAGLYAVFFVLATASMAANIGLGSENLAWGEQFTSSRFNIVMAAIVFAFALSFLGVWELPIPGFIGESAGRVHSQEGPLGSFLKGALSTVLATPCSGPFLGPVFGFTLGQPTGITYAVFAAIATGMALPYLVVGMLPGLVKFLPKPGAWMETLKEVLGFVMLGTVVFLFTFLNHDFFVPTFALLIGIWAACWWVGRSQAAGGGEVGFGRWVQAGAIVAAVGSLAFVFLGPVTSIIPWQTYSRARLTELRTGGTTVMIDFSADWCATCKLNLATAIETNRVKAAVEANGVVPLLADWTEGSSEIKAMLESLQSKSIPVLAFFPGVMPDEKPRDPIVLRDLITESQVLEAIRQAGPSRTIGPEVRAASAARGIQ